jgi:hypothetical protein
MDVTVSMRSHRILKNLPRYRTYDEGQDDVRRLLDELQIERGEKPVGFYQNTCGSLDRGVLITDRGLHVHRGCTWDFLPYEKMMSIDLEGGKKSLEVENLAIRFHDDSVELVPFTGGESALGTRDTFSLWTFLIRVLGDLKQRRTENSDQ